LNMDRFEELMSAIAFAEAGEHGTAREMLGGKKVLLVLLGKETDERSSRYALNICKRIGAHLEILCMTKMEALKQFTVELGKEGIRYQVTKKGGCVKKEIIGITEERKDIQFVVIESSEVLDAQCSKEDRALSAAWERLKCPLVLVSKGEITSTA